VGEADGGGLHEQQVLGGGCSGGGRGVATVGTVGGVGGDGGDAIVGESRRWSARRLTVGIVGSGAASTTFQLGWGWASHEVAAS